MKLSGAKYATMITKSIAHVFRESRCTPIQQVRTAAPGILSSKYVLGK
jgi:hypothetical protein